MASATGGRPFEVTIERVDGDCVVVFRGELDMTAVDDLWRCILDVRTSGRPIKIDLAGATFMDSSGIKLLLEAYAAHGRAPDAVTLISPSQPVRTVLAMTGVNELFRIEDQVP